MSSRGNDDSPDVPLAAEGVGAAGYHALKAGDRVGEYVLEEPIGQGGCGVVWRARHAVLPGVVVAVKLPRDSELIDLLRRESLLQHGLDHPGVLKVLGVDLDSDVPYVVQEYASGGDLDRLIRREGQLGPKRALALFIEIVEILAHAHGKGVVHSDLKPGNILLDESGRVRIADFGLGKGVETLTASALRESLDSLGPRTDGRHIGGTWEYMAPEVREGQVDKAPDPRVDIFALGIILYEMLTGSRPAGRVNLRHVSHDLDVVFARCWTSRDNRYRDAGELFEDLRRIEKKKPLAPVTEGQRGTPSESRGKTLPRRSKLRWFFWARLFPLILLAAVSGLVWLGEYGPAPNGSGGPDDFQLASETGAIPFLEVNHDEADELADLRRRIESEPFTVEEAAGLLREFRATADDPRLVELARRWESILPTSDEPKDYEVRWKRYRVHQPAYRRAFNLTLEPGRPDVYLNVYRTRKNREELVYTSVSRPKEAWYHDWSRGGDHPTFILNWARGEALRLELWEADVFGDNVIAEYQLDGELSILLVSTPLRSPTGHAIELASDFAFGR